MAANFVGTWKMEKSEKFDEYMTAVGVNAVVAKIGSTAKPTLIISLDGDTWTLKSETTLKKTKVTFKLGVEFDEETADGRKMKTTFTLDGNTLTQDQKAAPGAVPSVITREVDGNKMIVLCKAKDIVSTRHYVKSS